MINKITVLAIIIILFVSGLYSVSFAETGTINGTNSTIQAGNSATDAMNQSESNQTGNDTASYSHISDNSMATGGIKYFMKAFSYQSGV